MRVCGIAGEKEGNADYGGMVQPSEQHVPLYDNSDMWLCLLYIEKAYAGKRVDP